MSSNAQVALFRSNHFDRVAEVFAQLREAGSVHKATMPNGLPVWVITRYQDVRRVLTDRRLGKDNDAVTAIMRDKLAAAGTATELSGLYSRHMLMSDPPDHTRLRRILAKSFTPSRVVALRPRIHQITRTLLDALPTVEPVDLIAEFALPLPAIIISELLGVPQSDRAQFSSWTSAMMQGLPEITNPASRAMVDFLAKLIEDKRSHPGQDLLTALIETARDGDQLTDEELQATALLLLVAGHETTTNLIGNGARWLLDRSQLPIRKSVLDNPLVLPDVVDELLRYDSPVYLATPRYTVEPIVTDDVTIPAGEIVMLALGSANRDSSGFANADRLDPKRRTMGHVAFGYGPHYCLGAQLARAEGEIALGGLLRRFPAATLAQEPSKLTRRTTPIMNGYARLPVMLT